MTPAVRGNSLCPDHRCAWFAWREKDAAVLMANDACISHPGWTRVKTRRLEIKVATETGHSKRDLAPPPLTLGFGLAFLGRKRRPQINQIVVFVCLSYDRWYCRVGSQKFRVSALHRRRIFGADRQSFFL